MTLPTARIRIKKVCLRLPTEYQNRFNIIIIYLNSKVVLWVDYSTFAYIFADKVKISEMPDNRLIRRLFYIFAVNRPFVELFNMSELSIIDL